MSDRQIMGIKSALVVVILLFLLSTWAEASKRLAAVTGTFSAGNRMVQLGDPVDLVLHLVALAPAPHVEVKFVLPHQVNVVHGGQPWFGHLAQDGTLDLPLAIQIVEEGEYSIGAIIKVGGETSGAIINVIATAQGVEISTDPIFLMRYRKARTSDEQQGLLDRAPGPAAPAPLRPLTPSEQQLNQYILNLFQTQQGGWINLPVDTQSHQTIAASTTVSGTLTYKDDTGTQHPIRYALVQILDGATDTPLAETLTLANGTYSVAVLAASVKVRVLSEDGLRSVVRVNPLGSPMGRYMYTSESAPVAGPNTIISFATDQPVRGTPGQPSNDVIQTRAFIMFDALMQYQVQSFGLRGVLMPQTKANFPNGTESPCPTISCYSPGSREMYILREDALDWDVLGHEFFHYVTNQGANRPIDNNPGGSHSGGSAIGQRPCPTCPPRNRDEGMRLAWSEGLATFMSVRLQNEPASTDFGMVWPNVPDTGDAHYQDTEDSAIDTDLEAPSLSQGYGAENSIMGMFWDFVDTPQDGNPTPNPGNPTDRFDLTPRDIWHLVNSGLPCNPCDRVDRFWAAVFNILMGNRNLSVLLDAAQTLVLNYIGPELIEPAHGSMVSGAVSPIFRWTPNGDSSPDHQPNRFFLAISKNSFQGDLHLFPNDGQPVQTTQYQIPDAEWRALIQNATDQTEFSWVIIGYRDVDTDIRIPEGSGFFISNPRTVKIRAFHIQLTWNNLGADVDLHFRPPDGADFVGWNYSNDCAYYNRYPDWGNLGDATDNPSLDRDCITTCTEENITIDRVTTPGTYKALVHYYRDHGQGPSAATVNIFQNGTQIFTGSRTLQNTCDSSSCGELWTVLTFNVTTEGKIEGVALGESILMPGDSGLAPSYLKED